MHVSVFTTIIIFFLIFQNKQHMMFFALSLNFQCFSCMYFRKNQNMLCVLQAHALVLYSGSCLLFIGCLVWTCMGSDNALSYLYVSISHPTKYIRFCCCVCNLKKSYEAMSMWCTPTHSQLYKKYRNLNRSPLYIYIYNIVLSTMIHTWALRIQYYNLKYDCLHMYSLCECNDCLYIYIYTHHIYIYIHKYIFGWDIQVFGILTMWNISVLYKLHIHVFISWAIWFIQFKICVTMLISHTCWFSHIYIHYYIFMYLLLAKHVCTSWQCYSIRTLWHKQFTCLERCVLPNRFDPVTNIGHIGFV